MRILLTGGSSFTGLWFANELARAGHDVCAIFRKWEEGYADSRLQRLRLLDGRVERAMGIEFGDQKFIDLVSTRTFDLFLHHAAEMTGYRSWEFDAINALERNTRSGRAILEALGQRGCRRLILTGTVFEPFEGLGDGGQRAFNPYGLSKHLTFEWYRLEAERIGLSLGKFVISNPFGPHEEFRFTSYLAREWAAGRLPVVSTPIYVRDNIHVGLLSLAYRTFCETLPATAGLRRCTPSGYVESQGAFARRVGREMATRTGWACQVAEATQIDFDEPLIRINASPAAQSYTEWIEPNAWDELADFYRHTFAG